MSGLRFRDKYEGPPTGIYSNSIIVEATHMHIIIIMYYYWSYPRRPYLYAQNHHKTHTHTHTYIAYMHVWVRRERTALGPPLRPINAFIAI